MSRLRGREKSVCYPQTEGMLGDCMLHYGQELGAASDFGTKLFLNGRGAVVMARLFSPV